MAQTLKDLEGWQVITTDEHGNIIDDSSPDSRRRSRKRGSSQKVYLQRISDGLSFGRGDNVVMHDDATKTYSVYLINEIRQNTLNNVIEIWAFSYLRWFELKPLLYYKQFEPELCEDDSKPLEFLKEKFLQEVDKNELYLTAELSEIWLKDFISVASIMSQGGYEEQTHTPDKDFFVRYICEPTGENFVGIDIGKEMRKMLLFEPKQSEEHLKRLSILDNVKYNNISPGHRSPHASKRSDNSHSSQSRRSSSKHTKLKVEPSSTPIVPPLSSPTSKPNTSIVERVRSIMKEKVVSRTKGKPTFTQLSASSQGKDSYDDSVASATGDDSFDRRKKKKDLFYNGSDSDSGQEIHDAAKSSSGYRQAANTMDESESGKRQAGLHGSKDSGAEYSPETAANTSDTSVQSLPDGTGINESEKVSEERVTTTGKRKSTGEVSKKKKQRKGQASVSDVTNDSAGPDSTKLDGKAEAEKVVDETLKRIRAKYQLLLSKLNESDSSINSAIDTLAELSAKSSRKMDIARLESKLRSSRAAKMSEKDTIYKHLKDHDLKSEENMGMILQLAKERHVIGARETQFRDMYVEMFENLNNLKSSVFYLYGPHGSGKSFILNQVLNELEASSERKELPIFKTIEIDAFNLSSAKEVFIETWRAISVEPLSADASLISMKYYFSKVPVERKRSMVIILDHLETLSDNDQVEIISKFLEWSKESKAKMVFIALSSNDSRTIEGLLTNKEEDMTKLRITSCHFPGYNKKELVEITRNMLESINEEGSFVVKKDEKHNKVVLVDPETSNTDSDGSKRVKFSISSSVAQEAATMISSILVDATRCATLCDKILDLAKEEYIAGGKIDNLEMPLTISIVRKIVDKYGDYKIIDGISNLPFLSKLFLFAFMDRIQESRQPSETVSAVVDDISRIIKLNSTDDSVSKLKDVLFPQTDHSADFTKFFNIISWDALIQGLVGAEVVSIKDRNPETGCTESILLATSPESVEQGLKAIALKR